MAAPAGSTFEFDVISQGLELAGEVSVSIAHVQDDGATPEGGLETIARAGVLLSGSGGVATSPWQIYRGDGFARATFHGRIDREQIYAVSAVSELGETTALICVRNSTDSKIALPPTTIGTYPNVVETRTLYSSPSLNFGLPVASISGDRTTVVSYEGDRDTGTGGRYELRLQYDHTTGAVTGGAQEETNPDSGNWRDHDVASLFNVLALAHSGGDGVSLKLSYDRGATFAQIEQVAPAAILGRTRLVSVAMAADYSLAVSFWSSNRSRGRVRDLRRTAFLLSFIAAISLGLRVVS